MSHVDKINALMIINSIFILTVTATCITLVAFPLCAGDKKNKEERKERFEDQDNLGSILYSNMYLFSFLLYFLFGFRL
jgi:hypothetical protein